MNVKLSSHKIAWGLAKCAAALVLAHLVMQTLKFGFNLPEVYGLVQFFDLDGERNLPAIFSFGLFVIAAGILGLIAHDAAASTKKFSGRWAGLSVIFLWLSLDEILVMHEEWIAPLRSYFHTDGLLYYCWQLPYLIFLFVLLFIYFPFLKVLAPVRRWIITAAVFYFIGVLGCESVSGLCHSLYGARGDLVIYMILTTVEESCEMAGVILFIYALLEYARLEIKQVGLAE